MGQEIKIKFKEIAVNRDKLYKKTWDKIHHQENQIFEKRIFSWWKPIGIAASIALLIVSTLFVINLSSNKDKLTAYTSTDLSLQKIDIHGIAGTRTRIVLPDSSIIWLGGGTQFSYPIKFNNKNRIVQLKGNGNVYCQISPNKNKPFIVDMPKGTIQVLGTSFNIYLDNNIETTLIKGKINFTNKLNKEKYALSPSQQCIWNSKNNLTSIKTVNTQLYTPWVTGHYLFDNTPFKYICKFLSRGFDNKIVITNPKLKNLHLTGHFITNETLDEILSILQVTANYKYYRKKGTYYIE